MHLQCKITPSGFNFMINREIEKIVLGLLQKYPAINITRPRQSGKTTFVKNLHGDYHYLQSLAGRVASLKLLPFSSLLNI